jgi:cobalt/nickel transport protein
LEKKHIAMLLVAFIIIAIPFYLYNDKGEDYFGGSDDKASQAIESTGYTPWISSIWEPPSSEMESLLFALQAAIGALIIGYFLGYFTGKRKVQEK